MVSFTIYLVIITFFILYWLRVCALVQPAKQNRMVRGYMMVQLLALHIAGCYWQLHWSLCLTSWRSNVIFIYLDWPLKISFIGQDSPSSCTLQSCSQETRPFILDKKKDNKIVRMYWRKKKRKICSRCWPYGSYIRFAYWKKNKAEILGHTGV